MVTDWFRSSTPWDRPQTRPLRLAWLCALLLGLVYLHGVNAESTMAHATLGPIVPMHCTGQHERDMSAAETGPADADHPNHPDHHGSSHPGQECAAGQPQDGPGPAAPNPATAQRERASLATPPPGIGTAGAEPAEQASRLSTETAVLRI